MFPLFPQVDEAHQRRRHWRTLLVEINGRSKLFFHKRRTEERQRDIVYFHATYIYIYMYVCILMIDIPYILWLSPVCFTISVFSQRFERMDMAWNHLARGEKSLAQKCFAAPWRVRRWGPPCDSQVEVSMGVPQWLDGCCHRKSEIEWMMTGSAPLLGNHQIGI